MSTDYLEAFDANDLILLANDLAHDYHHAREEYVNASKRYFNQSIASNYVKEDDLIRKLENLKEMHDRYIRMCKILTGRGYGRTVNGWMDSNNNLFTPKDILHSA